MTSPPALVRVSVDVEVDPATAFAVFTDEIDAWYKKDRHTLADHTRTVELRFEPHVGGRLLDVYDATTGEGREMGRVTAWEPGRRLVFVDQRDTEVEVTFEPVDRAVTRVTLEHRGLERLRDAEAEKHARYGWRVLVPWYEQYLSKGAPHA